MPKFIPSGAFMIDTARFQPAETHPGRSGERFEKWKKGEKRLFERKKEINRERERERGD